MPHTGKSGDYTSKPGHVNPQNKKNALKRVIGGSLGTRGSQSGAPLTPGKFSTLGAKASASVPGNVSDKISSRREKIRQLVQAKRPTGIARPTRPLRNV